MKTKKDYVGVMKIKHDAEFFCSSCSEYKLADAIYNVKMYSLPGHISGMLCQSCYDKLPDGPIPEFNSDDSELFRRSILGEHPFPQGKIDPENPQKRILHWIRMGGDFFPVCGILELPKTHDLICGPVEDFQKALESQRYEACQTCLKLAERCIEQSNGRTFHWQRLDGTWGCEVGAITLHGLWVHAEQYVKAKEPCQKCLEAAKKLLDGEKDPINPNHYKSGKMECIDALEAGATREEFTGFLKLTARQYLWRERNKNGLEDLKKAQWYIDRLIKFVEG